MTRLLTILLLTIPTSVLAEWVEFSTGSNGDVYFFDNSRVEMDGKQLSVWTRIRYKTSVMAASSYESHLRLDCDQVTETVLQSTFFTDKEWTKPAMATNTNIKPTETVKENTATEQLMNMLCKE